MAKRNSNSAVAEPSRRLSEVDPSQLSPEAFANYLWQKSGFQINLHYKEKVDHWPAPVRYIVLADSHSLQCSHMKPVSNCRGKEGLLNGRPIYAQGFGTTRSEAWEQLVESIDARRAEFELALSNR